MTPEEFFEEATVGMRIRYDKGCFDEVRIYLIHRECRLAYGSEVATGRKVRLILCNDMLKVCGRGCFNIVELVG